MNRKEIASYCKKCHFSLNVYMLYCNYGKKMVPCTWCLSVHIRLNALRHLIGSSISRRQESIWTRTEVEL